MCRLFTANTGFVFVLILLPLLGKLLLMFMFSLAHAGTKFGFLLCGLLSLAFIQLTLVGNGLHAFQCTFSFAITLIEFFKGLFMLGQTILGAVIALYYLFHFAWIRTLVRSQGVVCRLSFLLGKGSTPPCLNGIVQYLAALYCQLICSDSLACITDQSADLLSPAFQLGRGLYFQLAAGLNGIVLGPGGSR